MGSLNAEIDAEGSPVGVHTLSPGMVLTPLLLEGATDRNKAVFNILCEQPETVAAFLTPRIRYPLENKASSASLDCKMIFLQKRAWAWQLHTLRWHCRESFSA